ncbi:MAG: hypothetical protein KY055_00740 [Candidatus Nealsonbacteria bacterium]|nr:hypothetical protein [Candidatus Nealsonbacteria bacterium]
MVELLIVISILGLLASILLAATGGVRVKIKKGTGTFFH